MTSPSLSGIGENLDLERKIESRKRNFSLNLKKLNILFSLSILNFREWNSVSTLGSHEFSL